MTTIVTRAGKGSPLTHTEVDINFTNLNTNKLEAGAIALGSAATPSISFTGDTNTGIFSPGADQLAVATNGTGQLFISSLGNLGIGAASPSAWSYGGNITIPGAGRYIASTGDDIRFASNVYSSDVDRYVANGFATRYRMSDGTHQWATAVTGTAGNAITYNESMRITAGGLVGIGTSAPTSTLHIQHAAQTTGYWEGKGLLIHEDATANQGIAFYSRGSNEQYIASLSDDAASYLIIGARKSSSVNGVDAITIRGDGKCGIGTTSPGAALEINAAAATSPFIAKINTAEAARIDSSGRLLVGTSTYAGNGKLITAGNTGGDAGTLDICWTGSRPTAANTDIGYIRWYSADNSAGNAHYASIYASSDEASSSGSDIPGRLVFSTTADGGSSPTERMRIDNLGRTNFFCSGNDALQSRSSSAAGTSNTIFVGRYSATNTLDGSTCILIFTNGNIQNTNNSYGAISDLKLKENIVNATSQWSDIKALQVRKYNFKEETGQQTHTQIGLVAQEVELVSPGLVNESPDRDAEGNDLGTVTKSVNYSVLYMKAVKALQEAMGRIETLEQRLTAAGID